MPKLQEDMVLALERVAGFLRRCDITGYLVGGCVRDILLGRPTRDLDIALEADAIKTGRELADELGTGFFVMDETNGVARVALPEGKHLDITTIFDDLKSDLARRDFAIDAMAIRIDDVKDRAFSPTVIDPYDGQRDVREKLVRALGESAFRKDPARLMRAVRLACELGFSIEEETFDIIKRDAHLVSDVAGERVRDELWRILSASTPDQGLRSLDSLGLLTAIIPELEGTKGVEQPKEHFWDVFNHSIETVANLVKILGKTSTTDNVLSCVPWLPAVQTHLAEEVSAGRSRKTLLLLAGLLHDIAKPQTKGADEDGRIRFLGHSQLGAKMAVNIMERLRFSRHEVRMVQAMILHHLRPGQLCSPGEMPTQRAIYRYFRDTEGVGIDLLYLNLADYLAARGPSLEIGDWREHTERLSYTLSIHLKEQGLMKLRPTSKLIDGHDLINIFGMKPGKAVGRLLEVVREAQASGEVGTREEALALVERSLKAGTES
ncbi:MAG: HD domain-containing protein [Chloroflexi bacterium]|nr:HD domain-containing protein [Chloroflexota bacterium]